MPTSRRSLILLTVVLAAAVFAIGWAMRPAPQATLPAGPAPVADAGETSEPVARTLKLGAARSQSVRATVGEPLRLTVQGAGTPDVVVLEGLDQQQQISPDGPAVFDLLPEETGAFAIVLTGTGERVGTLRVGD